MYEKTIEHQEVPENVDMELLEVLRIVDGKGLGRKLLYENIPQLREYLNAKNTNGT